MQLVRINVLCGLIFLFGIHLCLTEVTITMSDNFNTGYRISLTLIPDTDFGGGFEVLIELNSPADISVSCVCITLTIVTS